MKKQLALLIVVLLISFAYAIQAGKAFGWWGFVLYILIWLAVFWVGKIKEGIDNRFRGNPMNRKNIYVVASLVIMLAVSQARAQEPEWVAVSNRYTKRLMDLEMKHHPEEG